MRFTAVLAVVPSVLALALVGVAMPASAAPTASLRYIDVEIPGADYTVVTGVDDDGVIVG